MHYSDIFKTLVQQKHIFNETDFQYWLDYLAKIEDDVLSANFFDYLSFHKNSAKNIWQLWKDFQKGRLNYVEERLDYFKSQIPYGNPLRYKIERIQHEARKQSSLEPAYTMQHFYGLAYQFGSVFMPFSQNTDPFKDGSFKGYCWGHTYRYGKLVHAKLLNTLSTSSDRMLVERSETNWQLFDLLFRRIGIHIHIRNEQQLEHLLWDTLNKLTTHNILNFNYMTARGFHSTAIRMVNRGVEFYDSNNGLVQFSNRDNFVKFMMLHMKHESHIANPSENKKYVLNAVTVYQLPYTNDVNYNPFASLEKLKISQSTLPAIKHDPIIELGIAKLNNYAANLLNQIDNESARIKAYAILAVVNELKCMTKENILVRLNDILSEPKHGLIVNRGTGLYFICSGFKSHSSTESILQELRDNIIDMQQNSFSC